MKSDQFLQIAKIIDYSLNGKWCHYNIPKLKYLQGYKKQRINCRSCILSRFQRLLKNKCA